MSFFRRIFGVPQPPDATARAEVTTQPIAVGPLAGDERIAQAKYRVSAITRYIDECAQEGVTIAPAKIEELESERLLHVVRLRQAGVK